MFFLRYKWLLFVILWMKIMYFNNTIGYVILTEMLFDIDNHLPPNFPSVNIEEWGSHLAFNVVIRNGPGDKDITPLASQ